MQPLDLIQFNVPGFALQGDSDGLRIWHGPLGDGIGLSYSEPPPNIRADWNIPDDVRSYCRMAAAASQMGLVEADPVALDGCRALRSIGKQPQQPSGMRYMGLLLLPFRDFGYVLRVQCEEHGITGIRDSAVLDAMLGSGQIDLSQMKEGGPIPGWMQDPYDPRIQSPLMRNLSEDPRYDAQFPAHPLSRARAILGQVQASLRIAPQIKAAPPFAFVSRA